MKGSSSLNTGPEGKNNNAGDYISPALNVDRGGIEPPTHGFSGRCSTN